MGGTGPLMAAQGGLGVFSAYQSSKAQMEMSEYQASIYESNQRLAGLQADDAIRRGTKEADKMGAQTSAAIGSQRVAMAANGIELGYGSAADIEADTKAIGLENANTIRNNAWREAWGYKVDAANSGSQAAMTRLAGAGNAKATLITGGLKAIDAGSRYVDSQYRYTKGKGTEAGVA